MTTITTRQVSSAIALGLALSLAACNTPANRSLNSVHQPVVERSNYALDVTTTPGGLPVTEQQRVLGWFDAMDLRYGDRVALDDPAASPAVREAVQDLLGRRGLLLADGAPMTAGYVQPGQARIVLSRSSASVPGCPDWSKKSDLAYENDTSSNFGCAINSTFASMVANPEDLISGQTGTGETVVTTSTKAIRTYRDQEPTSAGGLNEVSSTAGSGGGGN
ncbi:CpaD family pilus assembly protein [Qipengyuania spongiae]|uniref:CpaD family pilus assembly protein n=1 Tax=Qipengyuania spongiae TaxID=2909673 RepID=A0ABY5T0Z0_9SPHN|nr:CpaD family pilus assembly lipoprotein [Qipengyuania spongiae]UVI40432.1 CpaD family pilus assembly protein [Qipengyuania spongiae]